MSEPFVGEIRIWATPFAPRGWALCAGQMMSVSQNQALFSILGTAYGGDGRTTFCLPDLRGRVALGPDASHPPASWGGEPFHSLALNEIPAHTHVLQANTTQAAKDNGPFADPNSVLGNSEEQASQGGSAKPFKPYGSTLTSPTPLHPSALAATGAAQPHENRQPYLGLSVCIALLGIYPSRG